MSSTDKEYVLVTEYFHPDTASTGQLMTELAVGLQERGLDMTVYTGQPNYHSGDNDRQPQSMTYKGVTVKRIGAPQVRQSSLIRRGCNWLLFTVWMSLTLLVSRPRRERELIFVSNPPFLPLAMWMVCRLRNWEYTHIVYDLYPDTTVEMGYFTRGGLVDRFWSALNSRMFKDAKHIVALGPAMRDRISGNCGADFDTSKVAIIHNWADDEFITPREKSSNWFAQEHDLVDAFAILYSGNIGEHHDLETLVEATATLETDEASVLIIGEGEKKDDIVALAEERGLVGSQIEFLPYQPLDDLPYSLTAGDISVVTVQEGMEGICVSSKLYTALAAGTPVLVISSPTDDEARIVNTFDVGLNAQQGDYEEVAEAIKTWITNPELFERQRKNARDVFEAHFTKDHSIDRYHTLLDDNQSLEPDPVVAKMDHDLAAHTATQ